jgi:hypothetical protein
MKKKREKEKIEEPEDDSRDTEVTDLEDESAAARAAAEEGAEDFNGKDRRKHQRVKVKLHMIYEDGKTGIKTNVVNISLGGAFLEMPKPPQEGTEIRLTPILPNQGPESSEVHLKGRVVRVVEYNLPDVGPKTGVGIEFTDIDSEDNNVLSEIFRKSLDEAKSEAESEEVKGEEEECSKTGEWNPPEDEIPEKK